MLIYFRIDMWFGQVGLDICILVVGFVSLINLKV